MGKREGWGGFQARGRTGKEKIKRKKLGQEEIESTPWLDGSDAPESNEFN